MKIGLGVAQLGRFADPRLTRRVAVAAEEAGYSSLWVIDRLLAPVAPSRPYPVSSDGAIPPEQYTVLDPVVTLTLAAAVTERIRLGTSVLVAPWYPPMLLARSVASLDHVSAGRLTLGLGLGWSPDEYDAVGAHQAHRGLRLEEILDVLEVAWQEEFVEIETSREHVVPSTVGLKPFQRPRPPILLAASTPAGLERIGRRADGWVPTGVQLPEAGAMWLTIRESAARHGRDHEALRLVMWAGPQVSESRLGAGRAPFAGSRGEILGDLRRAEEIGATEVVLDFQGVARTADELLDLAASFAAPWLPTAAPSAF